VRNALLANNHLYYLHNTGERKFSCIFYKGELNRKEMYMYLGIIYGICIMSVFAMVAVMLADSGHEKLAIAFCGPAAWLWVGFIQAIRGIRIAIRHKRFKALLRCHDGEIRYIDSRKAQTMIECEDREYDFVKFDEINVKATRWPKEYRTTLGSQTVGNMRYCPKSVWKKYEAISKEDYKYAKTH
jgi:hypothetical protein